MFHLNFLLQLMQDLPSARIFLPPRNQLLTLNFRLSYVRVSSNRVLRLQKEEIEGFCLIKYNACIKRSFSLEDKQYYFNKDLYSTSALDKAVSFSKWQNFSQVPLVKDSDSPSSFDSLALNCLQISSSACYEA